MKSTGFTAYKWRPPMKSMVYVGMDVLSSNYTLYCYMIENDRCFATVQMEPDYKEILKCLDNVQMNVRGKCEFHCGYEVHIPA
jgi:hypothetical protein